MITAAGRSVLARVRAVALNDYAVALGRLVGAPTARSSPTLLDRFRLSLLASRDRRVGLVGRQGRLRRGYGTRVAGAVSSPVAMSTRLAIHSSSAQQAAAVLVVDDAGPLGHLQQHEVERRHRALAHDVLGQVGQRLVDELGLGPHAGERRRVGAFEQVLAQRQADHELEHEPDVVASVGRGEPRAAAGRRAPRRPRGCRGARSAARPRWRRARRRSGGSGR